jgi:3-phenylpropionate/trans-cinnamate dioxygenase ferredoxin reductase subunit
VWVAGGRARTLALSGADLDAVFSLRDYRDAAALREKLATAHHAVIISGGYIGLEAAAAFAHSGVAVTVIGVERIIGTDGQVNAVKLSDGRILRADFVVVGVGLISVSRSRGHIVRDSRSTNTSAPPCPLHRGCGSFPRSIT